MRYRVTHRTTYTYEEDVTTSFGLAHITPRQLAWQQVDGCRVSITPEPGDTDTDVDHHGNTVTYFQVTEPHTTLDVEALSEVTVSVPAYDDARLARPWEGARPLLDPGLPGAWRAAEHALASPKAVHAAEATAYAADSLRPGRPIGEAVTDLMTRIHADFDYDKTATTVTSTVSDTLAKRAGVCQDFAHLTLACLRGHGLAARYVSGYLATQPPPGRERVVGADASHAWVSVWVPGAAGEGEWLAIDPTNDQWANDRYVTVAWGRDYGDVPPVKGIIYTDGSGSKLRVSVDVAPLDPAPAADPAPVAAG